MQKQVSFVTNLFEAETVKQNLENDGCYGEELARWINKKLKKSEFSLSEPYEESWFWEIEVKSDKDTFYIKTGMMNESIGEANNEWFIGIEATKSWFLFRKPNPILFEKLCQKINEILQIETEISQISWEE